jgi:hypothetical protein
MYLLIYYAKNNLIPKCSSTSSKTGKWLENGGFMNKRRFECERIVFKILAFFDCTVEAIVSRRMRSFCSIGYKTFLGTKLGKRRKQDNTLRLIQQSTRQTIIYALL